MVKKFLNRIWICLKILFGKEGEYVLVKNGPVKSTNSGSRITPHGPSTTLAKATSIIRMVPAIKFIIHHSPDCPSILWWFKTLMNGSKLSSLYADQVDQVSGRVSVTIKTNKFKSRFYLISEDVTEMFMPLGEGDDSNKVRGYNLRICYYIPPVITYDELIAWFTNNIYNSPSRKTFTKHLIHVWEVVLNKEGYSYTVNDFNNDKLWADCEIYYKKNQKVYRDG